MPGLKTRLILLCSFIGLMAGNEAGKHVCRQNTYGWISKYIYNISKYVNSTQENNIINYLAFHFIKHIVTAVLPMHFIWLFL